MQTYDMNDGFVRKGVWWFPNSPKEKRFGTLSWDGETLVLELVDQNGQLSVPWGLNEVGFNNDSASMLGCLDNGNNCTLYGIWGQSRPTRNGNSEPLIQVGIAYIGAHFPLTAGLCFRWISLDFTDVSEWMFDRSLFQEDQLSGGGWRVALKHPQHTAVYVPAIDSTLNFGWKACKTAGFTSHTLKVTPDISVGPSTPQSIDWLLNVARDLQNWLSLLIGRLVYPKSIRVSTDRGEEVQVIRSWTRSRNEELRHPTVARVPFNWLKDKLDVLLPKWFLSLQQLRDVFSLFFATIHSDRMYIEFNFLSLIQAIEAYSRANTKSEYLQPAEYDHIRQALVQAIPATVPSDLRESLKNKLKYGNEYSLRKRLKELLQSLDPTLCGMVCANKDLYIKRVVATRNYLTHYTDELKTEAWHPGKMYHACQSMTVLLTIILLQESGFEDSQIQDILDKHAPTRGAVDQYLTPLL